MSEPLTSVSVVLATNRVSPYLDEALDSAARQSVRPFEIVVVDDGSPDPHGVDAVAARHAGVRVVHRDAQGVSSARNAGAALASGAWIAFLDDDDRWHPERLERQLATLSERPDAVVGYCGLRTIDASGVQLAAGEHVQVDGTLDILRQVTGILVPNTLIRRDAFDAVGGFDEQVRFAEDLDLMIRLGGEGVFVLTSADLVDYRLHGSNTTGNYRALCRGVDHVLRRHRTLAAAAGDSDAVDAAQVGLRANRRYAWWRARRAGGVRELAWAARFAPLAPVDIALRRLGLRDRNGSPGTDRSGEDS